MLYPNPNEKKKKIDPEDGPYIDPDSFNPYRSDLKTLNLFYKLKKTIIFLVIYLIISVIVGTITIISAIGGLINRLF